MFVIIKTTLVHIEMFSFLDVYSYAAYRVYSDSLINISITKELSYK